MAKAFVQLGSHRIAVSAIDAVLSRDRGYGSTVLFNGRELTVEKTPQEVEALIRKAEAGAAEREVLEAIDMELAVTRALESENLR